MRTKNSKTLFEIKSFVDDYCDKNGRGPSLAEISKQFGICKATAQRYLAALKADGDVAQSKFGYESLTLAENRSALSVPILGAVPCGPLTEVEEYIEGYLRLPESFIGKGKFYLLRASGDSMIGAGINDGDLVLVKLQNVANVGEIVVALVDNEVTLKRLAYSEEKKTYYLHPENKRMKNIYPEDIEIQGIAIKVIKNLI